MTPSDPPREPSAPRPSPSGGPARSAVAAAPLHIEALALPDDIFDDPAQTAEAVREVLNRHLKSPQPDPREAARDLFQGHGFSDWELLRLRPGVPRLPAFLQAALEETDPEKATEARAAARRGLQRVETGPLRAAYTALLAAIEDEAAPEVLEKRQEMAYFERMRNLARRIVDYEFAKARAEQQARALMTDAAVAFVQVLRPAGRPSAAVCDFIAEVDRYGLGAGVFPKAFAPRAPHGWACACEVQPRKDLPVRLQPVHLKRAELEHLQRMPEAALVKLFGSRSLAQRALEGHAVLELLNRGRHPLRALVTLAAYSAKTAS